MKIKQMINSGIATSGMIKKDHYSWDDLDSKCRHMRIPIHTLNVDPSYQRGEASNTSTLEKAKHMQHAAMGAIIVAKRQDGTFWIVDGLQRTLAAQRRGDVTGMDCMVFDSRGSNHEADVFLLCNKGRIAVSAYHKYKTSVTAGRMPESEIDAWINERGYTIGDQPRKSAIRFPTKLIQAWTLNKEACKQALDVTREICENGELNSDIFCAVAILIRNGINVKSEVKKILSLGGATKVLKEINTTAITLGLTKSWKVCGIGLLSVINYKRQKKIRVESWDK
jgi:hypothetical protein